MTTPTLYALIGVTLVALALHSLLAVRHLLRRLIAANVMGSGIFLVFIAMSHRPARGIDPVPHAMVLTGIVVAVAATGLGVALVRKLARGSQGEHLPEDVDAQEDDEP